MEESGWLTLEEAGRVYNLTPSTLRQQILAGKLKAQKRAGAWFTRGEYIEEYRREHPRPGRRKASTD